VFIDVLRTTYGKSLIREYEYSFDAQSVWMRLLKYHSTSTGAVLANDKLLSALQENRLGRGSKWKGSTHDYVITWETNAELYNAQLRDPNARLNDAQKLNMLQHAVSGITQLLVVKTSIDLHISQGNAPIEYPQYYALLLSACSTYDEANGLKNGPTEANNIETLDTAHKREVNVTEGNTKYETFVSKFYKPSQTRMTKDVWNSITKEGQEVWDTLSREDKANILNFIPKTGEREVNIVEFDPTQEPPQDASDDTAAQPEDNSTMLINAINATHPANLTRMLGNQNKSKDKPNKKVSGFMTERTHVPNDNLKYRVAASNTSERGALIDRGANGGIAGSDTRIITESEQRVDLSGIDSHEICNIKLGNAGAVVRTQHGEVIVIMNNYALVSEHKTIHSSAQIESYKNKVDDRAPIFGGTACITTLEDYKIPMHFKNGLAYIEMRPFTDDEFSDLPHVFLTSEVTYDPTSIDFEIDDEWYDAQSTFQPLIAQSKYDERGYPKPLSILEANILEFAVNDDPDFLEEFEDDDPMPGLLEKTPHLASWYYTPDDDDVSEASSMPELLDRPEDSSSDDDSDDESVPDLHAAKYGIWNLEGDKILPKENTTDEDDSDDRPTKVKTRSKRASRAARRNKKRKSADKSRNPSVPYEEPQSKNKEPLTPSDHDQGTLNADEADKGTENKSEKPLLLLKSTRKAKENPTQGPNLVRVNQTRATGSRTHLTF
jgi:hypothetical protein